MLRRRLDSCLINYYYYRQMPLFIIVILVVFVRLSHYDVQNFRKKFEALPLPLLYRILAT